MILPPSEWYRQQDLSQHFMRDTSRPFEEGVSRGQLRCIKTAEDDTWHLSKSDVRSTYAVIADNRMSKGRKYGMRLADCASLMRREKAVCFDVYSRTGLVAAAFCVKVSNHCLYVSGWGHIEVEGEVSPIPLLCKGIYNWCAANNFRTLDIGIAGDENLANFKRRLGFKRACDAE